MGKRSNFERVEKDFYRTIDTRAAEILQPFLLLEAEDRGNWGLETPHVKYAEPCFGQGDLAKHLCSYGHLCRFSSDITFGRDALGLTAWDIADCDLIITNPPWSRPILHSMITHFSSLKPTWLLFDADWCHTKQSSPYMKDLCTDIVSVGRLRWIEGTTMQGKDNCAWYRFHNNKTEHTRFHGR